MDLIEAKWSCYMGFPGQAGFGFNAGLYLLSKGIVKVMTRKLTHGECYFQENQKAQTVVPAKSALG